MTNEVEHLRTDDPDYIMIREYQRAHNILDRDCNVADVIVLMRRARQDERECSQNPPKTKTGAKTWALGFVRDEYGLPIKDME